MKNKAYFLLMACVICFTIAGVKTVPYFEKLTKIQQDFVAKKIDDRAKMDMALSAMVGNVGGNYLWHLGGFVFFCGAMHYVHNHVRRWWAKLIFAVPTFGVFCLATAFFLIADEGAKFISENARALLFQEIVKIKLSSIILGLFAGRLCFEMFRPFVSKED